MRIYKIATEDDIIVNRVKELLMEAESLPIIPLNGDLWQERNYRENMVAFFSNILDNTDDKELLNRLEIDGLEGTSYEIYSRVNSAGHPIRDRLLVIPIEKKYSK